MPTVPRFHVEFVKIAVEPADQEIIRQSKGSSRGEGKILDVVSEILEAS
jgi:hypothetical protein